MAVTVRQEAQAIHAVLVTFPGAKVDTVLAPVRDEVLVLAGMRRPPTKRKKR